MKSVGFITSITVVTVPWPWSSTLQMCKCCGVSENISSEHQKQAHPILLWCSLWILRWAMDWDLPTRCKQHTFWGTAYTDWVICTTSVSILWNLSAFVLFRALLHLWTVSHENTQVCGVLEIVWFSLYVRVYVDSRNHRSNNPFIWKDTDWLNLF